jgi:hypothetical protein
MRDAIYLDDFARGVTWSGRSMIFYELRESLSTGYLDEPLALPGPSAPARNQDYNTQIGVPPGLDDRELTPPEVVVGQLGGPVRPFGGYR